MIFTNDLSNGLNSLRIKLPLFILPLVIGTSDPLKAKEWKSVLMVFLCSLCASVLVVFLVKYDLISPKKTTDQTETYLFLCLILDMQVLLSFVFPFGIFTFVQKLSKVTALVSMVIIALGLYQLNSFTSYLAITLAVLFLFLYAVREFFVRYRVVVIDFFSC